jgi:suppressor of G2 allele of SKP1
LLTCVWILQALEVGGKLGDYASSGIYEARAYAHIKLQQWMEAVQDASKAVELDPNNAKAYLRKG